MAPEPSSIVLGYPSPGGGPARPERNDDDVIDIADMVQALRGL